MSETPRITDPTKTLLRIKQVTAQVPLSTSTIYRKIADGTFPAPVKIAERVSVWRQSDVDAWVDEVTGRGA